MKKINQIIVDRLKGDCTRACLASLLELDIYLVPNFIELGGGWFDSFWKFLRDNGYKYYGTGWIKSDDRPYGQILYESPNIDGLVIASVPSKTFDNIGHSVIMNLDGLVIHDPNPNKAWEEINIINCGLQHWMMIGKYDEVAEIEVKASGV